MPNLTVEENVFVGREPNNGRLCVGASFAADPKTAQSTRSQARSWRDRPRSICGRATNGRNREGALAQCSARGHGRAYSALTETEVTALFSIIRGLKARGLAVIYISHRLEEIFAICDRVTVLRDGQLAGELPIKQASPDRLVRLMVGRPLGDLFRPEEAERRMEAMAERSPDPILTVSGLGRTGTIRDPAAVVLEDISFTLRPGEIVGLSGLVGSGRTEIARAIFGADDYDRGEIHVEGRQVNIRSPRDAIRLGMGLVPEDRKLQALILKLAIRENLGLSMLRRSSRFGIVNFKAERAMAKRLVDSLERADSVDRTKGAEPFRRQPTKGRHCEVARPSPKDSDYGRTDARNRHRRESGSS